MAAVLAAVSLSLMLLDLRGGPTDALRAVGAVAGGPVQTAADSVFGPLRTAGFRRADTEQLQQRVAELEEANRRLALRGDALAEQVDDQGAAAAAEQRAADMAQAAVAARVVAGDPALGAAAVTLDAGAADGIVPDAPVLVAGGLVGRVATVSGATSSVLLLTDPASAVAVRVGDHAALVRGTGNPHAALLDHVDPLADLGTGQKVTTLGSDDGWPYPPGLTVGSVRTVSGGLGDLAREITVEPAVTTDTVDHVIVLRPPPGVTP